MSYQKGIELAKEKLLQAEAALESHVRSGANDPEQHKQLAVAVKVARGESIDQLASLCPDIATPSFDAASPDGTDSV